tara:strand:- start:39 stop:1073 length:1035 start_codon:yes stop_codon:yes gene_type:complete
MAFKRLDPEDFIVSVDTVTQPAWTGNVVSLSTFFTSSAQTEDKSGKYYLSVFNKIQGEADSSTQFDIAFCNKTGLGSTAFNPNVSLERTFTRTLYGQYRSLVLEDETKDFNFGGVNQDSFYVLSISRARYKEKLLPGSFTIILNGDGDSNPNLSLTDNSLDVTTPIYFGSQRAYNIVRGSEGKAFSGDGYTTNGYTTNSGSYGLFLPDTGTIILNAAALDLNNIQGINLSTEYNINSPDNNNLKLFNAISASGDFRMNSQETISTDFVFVRARNSEFNYSENPSFISGLNGEVIYDYFINNPQVYPTSVGLYNDSNELLAVAKLSRPLRKDFTKEALIRVRLDF